MRRSRPGSAPGAPPLAAAGGDPTPASVAPVRLQLGVSYPGRTLVATKTLTLGQPAANPTLDGVTIDGKPAGDGEIVVGKLVKVPLSIDADDANFDVRSEERRVGE